MIGAALLLTMTAAAAATPPPARPTSGPAAAEQACEPKCRAGFACVKGKCVSACNPPCAAGETCTAEGECVSPNGKPAARPGAAPTAGPSDNKRPLGTPAGPQFDPAAVLASVQQKQPEVQACYVASLGGQGDNIENTLETSFVVAPDGSVRSAFVLDEDTRLYPPSMRSCVAAVLQSMHFAPPADGLEHRIKVPFRLRAEGGDEPRAAPEATHEAHSHVERRNLKPLWLTGLIIDLAFWAIRGTITAATCSSAQNGCDTIDIASASLPVFGGWLDVGKGAQVNSGGFGNANLILLTFSSLVETVAFAAFVTGLIIHRDVVVEDEPVSLWLAPALDGRGAAFGGRF